MSFSQHSHRMSRQARKRKKKRIQITKEQRERYLAKKAKANEAR